MACAGLVVWCCPHSLGEAGLGLAFLTVLCPSARFYAQRGRRHPLCWNAPAKPSGSCGAGSPDRELVFVADSSFAALEWLALVARLPHVSVITRLRLDAALCDPPPPRAPGQRGRPRLKETPADPGDGVGRREDAVEHR